MDMRHAGTHQSQDAQYISASAREADRAKQGQVTALCARTASGRIDVVAERTCHHYAAAAEHGDSGAEHVVVGVVNAQLRHAARCWVIRAGLRD